MGRFGSADLASNRTVPPGKNVGAKPGLSAKMRAERFQPAAITCGTGRPSSAARIAGANTSFIGIRPNLPCSVSQPSTVPGTVHEYGLYSGIQPRSVGSTLSAVSARGERPDPFNP